MKKLKRKVNKRLGYLSYSKKKLFERGEAIFASVYFDGNEPEETARMAFGKMLAEALEDGLDTSDDELIAHALMFLPRYPKREHKIKVKFEGIEFLSSYDGYVPKEYGIGEVKSGTTPWSQSMVDRCEQLTFYAMVHYFRYKRLPGWIRLHWLNTATGEVKTFETSRTKVQVLRYFSECKKSWQGIKKLIKQYESK